MAREIPGSSSQHFYGNEVKVSTSDKIAAHRNENNIYMQSSEEFSPQFSQDRASLRRVLDLNQLRQVGFNYNQKNQLGYENLIGTHGIRRKDSDSDAVDCVSRMVFPGHAAELENRVFNDNVGRYQWACVPNEQKPSRYADEMKSDRVTLVPTTPPNHVLESPWPCHPSGTRVSESAFSSKMKFLCSLGGKILPRPNDGKLRYVGGETRIISIRKNVTWQELAKKTSAICDQPHTIKYQLPGEDLDALISVSSDEDLSHMIEEYQMLERNAGSQRLHIFLVSSVDPDSPNSFQARTPRQSNADYQYVVAVNSMLDFSPHKSSSGQSSTSQLGTSSDYRNQSLPVSPVNIQHRDNKNNSLYYVDPPASAGLMQSANLTQRRQCIVVTNQTSKPFEVHHHNRSSSGDFLPYQLFAQSPTNTDRPVFMEREISDTQLQEYNEPSKWLEEAAILLPLWNNRTEKSPSLATSTLWPHVMNGKHQVTDYENWCNNIDLNQEVINWMDKSAKNYHLDRAQCVGNIKAASNGNDKEHKNLPKLDCMPRAYRHPQDSQEYGRKVCITQVNAWENYADAMMKHPSGNQSGTDAPNAFAENQNVTNNRQDAMTERASGRVVPYGNPGHLPSPSHGSKDQESKVLSSKSVTSTSNRLFPVFVEEHVDCPHRKFENVNAQGQSYAGPKDGDAYLFVQPRPSDNQHDDKVLEPMVIVEDVTGTTPTDTLLSSSVVPLVEEEDTSDGHTEAESMTQEYESDDVEGYDRDINKSLSDAVMAEIEAGIYHLQVIKNADIEEVQELGSGTFGTVYYGKWRGTDVAIKRIKSSCFSGKSSEQERLTRDFWRQARILSDLHHPNVLAFYGVVPDGPGGTMATVTEYMVNGSLRHVLQKDRTLDYYNKLVLALDAAFGMEYLHLRDIIHFDLKCDNLLVNLRDPQRPICKVGDFGLSKIKRNTLVSVGVRGTLPWMAPELLDGSSNRVSEKVDVYSFGIAMWEILTGEEPYANMQFGAIIGGIANNTLRPRIPKRCDSEWRKLMEECWSFDPAARPSFTEITNRLRLMSAALQQKRRNFGNR